ncbi:MAG TPA: thiamine pyrophosphate-dependent enzyme [Coriobacteriia bacterium]|nr:thiamine pyrophosphate-dependent enzyme [Coriobacteriia bacterium]
MAVTKEFSSPIAPTWCPGCGNFQMFEALKRAILEMGWKTEDFAMFWGIGQHGNGSDFWQVQGFHALHGRSLPPATAFRLTRPDQHVIVEMGDGDGYGLGMGHFIHTVRRNVDITCIAHNNQIYGLTTGQASPTSDHLMKSPSTPKGVLEEPVNPIGLALAERATFVARGWAGDIAHLSNLYVQALSHKGFALVDVFQPCVTFNKVNTFRWFNERIYKLEEEGWDPSDRVKAFELSMSTFHDLECTPETCRIPVGVYYKEEGRPTYEDGLSATQTPAFKQAQTPRDVSAIMRGL